MSSESSLSKRVLISLTPIVVYTILMFFVSSGKLKIQALEKYSSGILIFLILLGVMLFSLATTINFLQYGLIALERIKTLILFICFLTLLALYYLYRGVPLTWWSAILYGLFSIIGLVYVLTIFSVSPLKDVSHSSNKIAYSVITVLSLAFAGFVLELTNTTNYSSLSSFSLLAGTFGTGILLSTLAIHLLTPPKTHSISSALSTIHATQKILAILTGAGIITVLLIWLGLNFKYMKNSDMILGMVLKIGFVVMCIFIIYSIFGKKLTSITSSSTVRETTSAAITTIKMNKSEIMKGLLTILLLTGIFIGLPQIRRRFLSQNGYSIINKPISTDIITNTSFNNSQTRETTEDPDTTDITPTYEFGMSFWVYINSAAPNTSVAYTDYASIISFGNAPNVLYNGQTNTIMITMRNEYISKYASKFGLNPNNNQERIIYSQPDITMQKWMHYAINYTGGTMDIFINGVLKRSVPGVVPYMISKETTIGQENGISGGVCNVLYFDKPIQMTQLYYLYDWQKNNTPPSL
jgi:hypothetical protein